MFAEKYKINAHLFGGKGKGWWYHASESVLRIVSMSATETPSLIPLLITEEIWDDVDFSAASKHRCRHPGPSKHSAKLDRDLIVLAHRINAILFSQTGFEMYECIKNDFAPRLCDNSYTDLLDLKAFASFKNFTITGAPSARLKDAWSANPAAVLGEWFDEVRARHE